MLKKDTLTIPEKTLGVEGANRCLWCAYVSIFHFSSYFNIKKDAIEIHLESSESLQRHCKVLLMVKKMMERM